MILLGTLFSIVLGIAHRGWSPRGGGARSPTRRACSAGARRSTRMPTQWLGLMLILTSQARSGCRPRASPTRTSRTCDAGAVARARRPAEAHGPAGAHARPRAARRVRADHALGDARDARRGLRADGAREGALELARSCGGTPSATRCCPITTLISLSLGYIVGGAILVEAVFNYPGIGAPDLPGGLRARLPDAAGRVPAAHGLGRRREPDRRPPVLPSSTRGSRMMSAHAARRDADRGVRLAAATARRRGSPSAVLRDSPIGAGRRRDPAAVRVRSRCSAPLSRPTAATEQVGAGLRRTVERSTGSGSTTAASTCSRC